MNCIINPDLLLSEIVASNPTAAGILLEQGIDFCCQGNRTLQAACEEQGLELAHISQLISDEPPTGLEVQLAINPNTCSLEELQSYIVMRHHNFVETHTHPLRVLLEKINRVHGANHPELQELHELFEKASGELSSHMKKEELMLFPLIARLKKGLDHFEKEKLHQRVIELLDKMESEHSHEGDEFKRMTEITNNFQAPEDGCSTYELTFARMRTFRDDLFFHIHLENNILFPRTRRFIAEASSTPRPNSSFHIQIEKPKTFNSDAIVNTLRRLPLVTSVNQSSQAVFEVVMDSEQSSQGTDLLLNTLKNIGYTAQVLP